MQINSIQTAFQDKENRTRAKYIGAATVLSAGSAFLATKPAKDAVNGMKTSKRILKAGIAGVFAAAATTLLSLKKEEFIAIKDKAVGLFNKNNDKQAQAENNNETANDIPQAIKEMEPTVIQPEMQALEQAEPKEEAQLAKNPFETFNGTIQG